MFSSEEATAYHEAGHAVAAFLLNRGPRRATIRPRPDGSLGHVADVGRAQPPCGEGGYWNLDGRTRLRVDHRIIELMAGRAAEAHLLGYEAYINGGLAGARGDHKRISDLMDELAWPSLRQGDAYLRFLDAVTRDLIEAEKNWKLVEALAKALFERKTLSAPALRRVLVQAQSKPRHEPKLPYAAR